MDRRRTPGLSSLSSRGLQNHHYTNHGATLRTRNADSLSTQLSVFQSLLHSFAITHSKDIRANPAFRAEFARMCSALNIDFLASSYHRDSTASKDGSSNNGKTGGTGESIWTQLLGGSVNDFYFNLGVLIVEECRATRAENGGLISVSDLQSRISKSTRIGGSMEVSDDDIKRAVDSLAPLGSCFSIMTIGHRSLIRSVPKELNTDQSTVLEAIQVLGYVTVSMLQLNLGWERPRAHAVVEDLMADSLVWVDTQAGENEYWSPAFLTAVGTGEGKTV
ncbi:EAP30 domain containing protein [Pyrenophora tritici-repentis]|uniref:Vacuolar-sorting protein SNF8 n=2 Tax=Pyrenophora tritici-repentis TaxID=45151 RepID=A0A2W1FTB3_9PLEO|nr:vacuolar-sorting protein SNF8 [Pyrenophora tritici-repentis Pt-1C-BFP]KAI1519583.1 Vacuolar-sorting protein SNF8 [Pyrenophora tritici-repentis]EDU51202.1 vacuolar-sorting protein SNF8 [Pyrenophora tritici-repentis Pt-1C-BFP]KAI1665978.1 Vacuolar-sorting protein SNF8 [Pyrenophora tritici-repentis]KAI1678965.1 Vacuolar-sorting protein SNF8 [Pyrenophora tritici-repentis]PZC94363.1 EAP30 domain containing protein [Pyrenophora tritici-repentis]